MNVSNPLSHLSQSKNLALLILRTPPSISFIYNPLSHPPPLATPYPKTQPPQNLKRFPPTRTNPPPTSPYALILLLSSHSLLNALFFPSTSRYLLALLSFSALTLPSYASLSSRRHLSRCAPWNRYGKRPPSSARQS